MVYFPCPISQKQGPSAGPDWWLSFHWLEYKCVSYIDDLYSASVLRMSVMCCAPVSCARVMDVVQLYLRVAVSPSVQVDVFVFIQALS